MSPVEAELRSILQGLDRAGAEAALVGGLAVSVRAESRLTRDADLVVSVGDDTDAEAVLASLTRSSTSAGVLADLLFSSSGIEREIVAAAETSVRLIEQRGFARDRDLVGALAELSATGG